MAATPFDSAMMAGLFGHEEVARLFSDSAEIRAMMIVEGALAQVQADAGVIPQRAGAAIHRASRELVLDPAALAGASARNGVSVPGLVEAFRAAMNAPEEARFLHWGATSQDIQDSALMLRLRQALALMEADLGAALATLGALAETHAESAMAGRTYGQDATPTSFGAVVAAWGWPLLDLLGALPRLREEALLVSLSGAAGTGAALGPDPHALRAGLAAALGLGDPGRSWHTDRGPLLALGNWMSRASLACGKAGEDLILATQSGRGEIRLAGAGSSSTMPQKHNPVRPSAMVALARHVQGLSGTLSGAALHREQRDGAAWFTEWLVLPQLVIASAACLRHMARAAETIRPETGIMRARLDADGGVIGAEALSFALAAHMPRPQSQALVKALCDESRRSGKALSALLRAARPDLPASAFRDDALLGTAPSEARRFATAVARGL